MIRWQTVWNRFKKDGFLQTGRHAIARGAQELRRSLGERELDEAILEQSNALADEQVLDERRAVVLDYFENQRAVEGVYGRFRYSADTDEPVLYSSTYAALTRSLYNDLDTLSEEQRREWISYIASHQSEDGLFRDLVIANEIAETEDWWGWRHLTTHALAALQALGGSATRRFSLLEDFIVDRELEKWLEQLDWEKNADFASNAVQNIGTILQYARDFQGEDKASELLVRLFDWLDLHQDPETGLWGHAFNTPALLSKGVQTAYHLLLLYFYDRRPIHHLESLIDSLLASQNRLGGFGVRLSSSACEDIDSIDPLCRFYHLTDYRQVDIRLALERALPWILTNQNDDGGFVFYRHAPFTYGHKQMHSDHDQSGSFPTWFRTLSLAYLAQCLPDTYFGRRQWNFVSCPGYQFWKS